TLYMIEEGIDREAGEEGDNGVEIDRGAVSENKSGEQEKHVILVVEDHVDVRKYIREPLESLYTVVEAGD
ncbi:MAG: hypothetical protein GTO45_25830, partial [Candidatus Aminicenantes bacterium]|nr:hypothetical protein [Candidatus Aminicenantes bacterium]NIM82159.1 hypothetical protein [Candidatus Aminicenantes bacterium]NIN21560.1 hypothetical protein [Candidatus Aminicenantes bacterium]NIN45369.1 hypothetical protein [Candidatus Aminicenantes bacterium]NIN88190.1 hypothetical protein [Candidatus Aminicenantes bacterium]